MGDDLSTRDRRVVAVVQARMSSTRLPGKVLASLGGYTVLEVLLRRLRRARELDDLVVATSVATSDQAIAQVCQELGVETIRGPLDDVLARYVQASDSTRADAVVRITADCPWTDPELVDRAVRLWRSARSDYVANTVEPRTFPDGLDLEVIASDALRRVDQAASDPSEREHVTQFIRRHPESFTAAELRLEPSCGSLRITLDTPDDLRVLTHLMSQVGPDASMREILRALGVDADVTIQSRSCE